MKLSIFLLSNFYTKILSKKNNNKKLKFSNNCALRLKNKKPNDVIKDHFRMELFTTIGKYLHTFVWKKSKGNLYYEVCIKKAGR